MEEFDLLLDANRAHMTGYCSLAEARPSRRLVVLTCMDTRVDPYAALGLRLGEAHVLRNAGARVTEDVLRSLAVSSHLLGTESLVLMQHTRCGLFGISDEDLREHTGADLKFFTIDEHAAALQSDIAIVAAAAYLGPLKTIAGFLYDLDTGEVDDVERWARL